MPNARHHSRRALLAITLAGVALAPAAPRAAAPPGGGGKERYDSEVAALRGRLARLRQYAAEFPASLTDVEALAKTLPTPAAALELVRDRLALEPYPGILKGA
ncbi:MAG TPA: hypothetical protein VIW03_17335, partial [Anaeromyxobacter sp.]